MVVIGKMLRLGVRAYVNKLLKFKIKNNLNKYFLGQCRGEDTDDTFLFMMIMMMRTKETEPI